MNSWEKRDVFVYTRILKYILLKTTPEYTKDLKIKLLHNLTLSMLGNFPCFFCLLQIFSKSFFRKNSFRKTIRVSNSLDPDQARYFVGPDLGPNCLQTLSEDDTSR